MARRKIAAGTTSMMVPIFIQDTSSSVGAGLGSLVYNTAGLAAKYRRAGDGVWTTITLATATLGTFASGGFIADGGPVTGGYEVGIPNTAIAAGVPWCEILIYGAANMLAILIEFELDAVNYQDGTRMGLTALPNAAAAANGGLPTVDASNNVHGLQTLIAAPTDWLTAASVKADAVTKIQSGLSTYAGGDTSGVTSLLSSMTTLLSRLTNTRATNLDYLDVAVSSRSTYAGADTTGTTALLANVTTLLGRLSAQRATNLDYLDVAVSAVQTAVNNLNSLSALANIFGSPVLEMPDSGTTLYGFTFVVRDSEGHLVDVDGNTVTVAVANTAGTDRSGNLSGITHVSLGVYTYNYTVASSATKESLRMNATATVGSSARRADWNCAVEDYDSTSTLASILAKVTNLPADPTSETNASTHQTSLLAAIALCMQTSGYVAPHNANIDAIYGKLPANAMADETLVINATNALLAAVANCLQAGAYTAPPSAATIATLAAADILATPAHKLATNLDGSVNADVDTTAIADAVSAAVITAINASGVELSEDQISAIGTAVAQGLTANEGIFVSMPVVKNTDVNIDIGMDYLAADGLAVQLTRSGAFPSFAGGSAQFYVNGVLKGTCSIIVATGDTRTVQVELTAAITATFNAVKTTGYSCVITLANGHKMKPWTGRMNCKDI